jgi:hypothetical protein
VSELAVLTVGRHSGIGAVSTTATFTTGEKGFCATRSSNSERVSFVMNVAAHERANAIQRINRIAAGVFAPSDLSDD